MTGKRKILLTVLSLLLVCNLAFIWGNSLVSVPTPTTSAWGCWAFCPDSSGLVPQPRTAGAHCVEDGPLYRIRLPGRAVLRAAGHGTDREAAPLLPRVAGGFFAAAIDETIQIFTGRAPSSRTCGWISPGSRRGCWQCCWSGPLSYAPNRRNPPKRWTMS